MPPVEDIPVHERVRVTDEFRYGCWGLPPAKRAYPMFIREQVIYVEHNLSTTCRNIDWHKDPACEGCPSEKDTEYIERQTKLKETEVRQVLLNTVRVG